MSATTHWGQIVPSLWVTAKIATGSVTCLAHIFDMAHSKCLATDDFGRNASDEMRVNRPYNPPAMDLLIHATLTVTVAREQLPALDERIKTLLVGEIFEGEFEEHHGTDALAYDFKVRGGIPFPAFAAASQEFPQATITAEWINAAAGRKGRAVLSNGNITEHVEDAIGLGSADAPGRYLLTEPDGTLQLAFALTRHDAQTWAGYVLSHDRDALFQLTRSGDCAVLLATEGAAEWVLQWSLRDVADSPEPVALQPPQAVNAVLYAGLEQLAQDFVAEWIWFRDTPGAVNAIDVDRYARYGYTVRDANVRAARLYRMSQAVAAGEPLRHVTLDAEQDWIRDLLQRCWGRGSVRNDG